MLCIPFRQPLSIVHSGREHKERFMFCQSINTPYIPAQSDSICNCCARVLGTKRRAFRMKSSLQACTKQPFVSLHQCSQCWRTSTDRARVRTMYWERGLFGMILRKWPQATKSKYGLETWGVRFCYWLLYTLFKFEGRYIRRIEMNVPRSLQSWVSTIHTVVLTADVFQLFIKWIWQLQPHKER